MKFYCWQAPRVYSEVGVNLRDLGIGMRLFHREDGAFFRAAFLCLWFSVGVLYLRRVMQEPTQDTEP